MAERYDPADLRVAVIFLRAIRGWDQAELAAAASVPPSSISRCESGKSNLSPKSFERIVSAAGVPASTMERLFGVIRSARAAVTGAAATDRDVDFPEAIAAEVCDGVFEVVRSTAALLLAELADDDEPEEADASPSEEDRRRAPSLWARLERHTPAQRRALVEELEEFRNWALCELLCAKSREAAPNSAGRAVELAELALLIADLAPGTESWRSRLRGYAWTHLGHARRLRGDLSGAEEALSQGRRLWLAGAPGDPGLLNEARVLSSTLSDSPAL